MSIVMIETEAFNQIMNKLESIENRLTDKAEKPEELWLDSEQLCAYLNISNRTLQNYRDNGVIAFSQFGAKIWYKYKDVQAFLESNKKEKLH
jgi:excisionase family DNA binding protein